MKVSKKWLKELVNIEGKEDNLINLIPYRIQGGIKEAADNYFELDMKGYNRSDLLSMRGVAKEAAAIMDSQIKYQETQAEEYAWLGKQIPDLEVEIFSPDLCPVYCLARIEGLKVNSSPEEWENKLKESGMRSIDNVTDVTNLSMLEFGQPLHAFDASDVSSQKIIVRTANEKEELETLDSKKRLLTSQDLVIADQAKVLGIAGVMGGKTSEVKPSTTTILLEAAIFDPINLRQTAQRLNLPSEASRRFQHGLTRRNLLLALDNAIRMYQKMGGNLTGLVLIGDLKDKDRSINIRYEKIKRLVGIELTREQITEYLTRLNFSLSATEEGWKVNPPYYRLDINIEEDVIEEVARMYGYENIPAKPLPNLPDMPNFPNDQKARIKEHLSGIGLIEVQTYSFLSTDVLHSLNLDKSKLYRVINPISAETEYLRGQIWPNLVKVVSENLKYYEDVAIFEIGKIYLSDSGGDAVEKDILSIALSNGTEEPVGELLTIINMIFRLLGVDAKIDRMTAVNQEWFHPVRFYSIREGDRELGFVSEIHPRIANKFGTDNRIAVCQIDLHA